MALLDSFMMMNTIYLRRANKLIVNEGQGPGRLSKAYLATAIKTSNILDLRSHIHYYTRFVPYPRSSLKRFINH